MEYTTSQLGGNCPVQGTGRLGPTLDDGHAAVWYFRARGAGWSFDVWNSDEIFEGDQAFSVQGQYGQEHEAGWMEIDDAKLLIRTCVQLYEAQLDVNERNERRRNRSDRKESDDG